MKYYFIHSSVNGDYDNVVQSSKSKSYAMKTAKKRFESGCYKKVVVKEMDGLYLGDVFEIATFEKEED